MAVSICGNFDLKFIKMKYYLTLIIACISFTTISQVDSVQNKIDTIQTKTKEIDFGNVKVIVKDKKKHTVTKDTTHNSEEDEWMYTDKKSYPKVNFEPTFGIGISGLTQDVQEIGVLAPTSNVSLQVDLAQSRNYVINGNLLIDFTKNIGLLTGFGFEFNRFVFQENMQITPKGGHFISDTITAFSSYKFKTNYVQIPLMLKFQTDNESFKLAVGGTFSYNIGTKVKAKFAQPDAEVETSIKGNFNVAPVKLGLGLRVAYKGIGLYANYALTPMNDKEILHTDGKINITPFSVGITLGGL